MKATLSCPDKRVSGLYEGTWNSDRWGVQTDGGLVQWGRARLTNAGGTWIGSFTGVYTSETMDMITGWLTGTGDYKGLSMYMWETTDGPPPTVFHTFVFPGKPPPS